MSINESDIKNKFGKNLRRLRHQRGLSQEALADICELDRTYLGGAERGERNVSLLNIIRIADALNVPASELLLFDEGSE